MCRSNNQWEWKWNWNLKKRIYEIEIPDTEPTNLTKINELPEARDTEKNPQETMNLNLKDLRY